MIRQPVCQVCGSSELKEVLNLGLQPLCNEFKPASLLNTPEVYYPLSLAYCTSCDLVQLSYVISTNQVFGEQYTYLTGSTKPLVDYYDELAAKLVKRFDLVKGDLVVDIGSNDGTFLKAFKRFGLEVLGIEGTPKAAAIAIDGGIPTINRFFGKGMSDLVKKEVSDPGRIKLITAMNVLAHSDNINDFINEIRQLMNPGTIFISQSHYLHALLENLQFDTIYHEHLRYYSLKSIAKLFSRHGLVAFDADFTKIYGGSIIVYASLQEIAPQINLSKMMMHEHEIDIIKEFQDMKTLILKNKAELLSLLIGCQKRGEHVIGVGAPMKASTLLNFYGITPDLVDYLAEVNPLKIGTFSPGVRIPVLDERLISYEHVDYAIILSWNIADQIMEAYRRKGFKGKFIIPIPTMRIVP